MIYFHLINRSHEKKITFSKRQAINALIILDEKTNENFKMEINDTLSEGIKKEKKIDSLIFEIVCLCILLFT